MNCSTDTLTYQNLASHSAFLTTNQNLLEIHINLHSTEVTILPSGRLTRAQDVVFIFLNQNLRTKKPNAIRMRTATTEQTEAQRIFKGNALVLSTSVLFPIKIKTKERKRHVKESTSQQNYLQTHNLSKQRVDTISICYSVTLKEL